ncbi:MAG: 4-hydroxythreonine-4-phosphate dehydrogenase PdxA [Anaerotruncus sp.]|nr:4-hydroxythreonine-4-phosphate dehydrogenase PdxA [Anaerotruncus sp.]
MALLRSLHRALDRLPGRPVPPARGRAEPPRRRGRAPGTGGGGGDPAGHRGRGRRGHSRDRPLPPGHGLPERFGEEGRRRRRPLPRPGAYPLQARGLRLGRQRHPGTAVPPDLPDHGTAFDIAGKGVADARSMEEAVRLAAAFSATGS